MVGYNRNAGQPRFDQRTVRVHRAQHTPIIMKVVLSPSGKRCIRMKGQTDLREDYAHCVFGLATYDSVGNDVSRT